MFILCSTCEAVEKAVQVLSQADYVIMDCEGRDLGCADGALSLLSIGTPHADLVYLFDVLMLPHRTLQLLFNTVLSHTTGARTKTKVVWDGRMDYIELFYSFSCPIENVLDLQLVDVLSRTQRGERNYERIGRLARRAFPMSEVRKLQLEGVYVLNSMDGAVREHGIEGVQLKNESVKKLHADNLSDVWMARPLSDALLEYAASDIARIAALYDHFLAKRFLESAQRLRELSAHYVSMHSTSGKPEQNNIFLRGPFLPLSVNLQVSPNPDGSYAAAASSKKCSGCKRVMLDEHYPFLSGAVRDGAYVGKGKGKTRLPMCKICTLILAKAQYAEEQKSRQ